MSHHRVSTASLISLVATAAASLLLAAPALAQPVGVDGAGANAPSVPGPTEPPASAPVPAAPAPAAPAPAPAAQPASAEPSRPPVLVSPASAEDPDASVGGAPGSDFTILGATGVRLVRQGGLLQKKEGGGISLAVSALYRSGILGIGVFGDATAALDSMYTVGGMAGLALRTSGGFRAELLGTGGIHHYQEEFLRSNSATLPFAGLRAHLGWVFGQSQRGHFNLGAMSSLDWDLWRAHRHGDAMGGTNLVVALTAGATIDVGR